ncbi:hypothetical protein K8Q98_01045 [Candidatus Nomurabacteria bacterium]|nr:hypothetical protein [Candidatus Nomurabacteria bacterium]
MRMPYKTPEKKRENHKRYMKEVWYPLNKIKHIQYVKNIKSKINEYVLNYKKTGKCMDCGFLGKDYPQVLDFDHRKDKKFNVSEYRYHTSGINKVKEEIEKCDLVCANCHRVRTAKRKLK